MPASRTFPCSNKPPNSDALLLEGSGRTNLVIRTEARPGPQKNKSEFSGEAGLGWKRSGGVGVRLSKEKRLRPLVDEAASCLRLCPHPSSLADPVICDMLLSIIIDTHSARYKVYLSSLNPLMHPKSWYISTSHFPGWGN